jgi:predicted dehydrogenase
MAPGATAAPGPQADAPAKTRIAIAGLIHSHVWGYLGEMLKGEKAQLTGIAETVPDLIAEARRRGAPESLIHSDWRKMLTETKPEIVWAFVQNNRHLEIVEFCAPRGIHVMFEKPLASTFSDALKIQALARRHNIQVLTNYQMAWWPTNYAAKRAAESGELGPVWRLRGIVGHGGPGGASRPTDHNRHFFDWLTDPVQNGAGSLVDFGCYNALWSLWYLGRPERVYAQVNQLRPETFPKVEDNANMVLSYRNGVGIFEGSWDLPRSFQDLEVFGRNGSLYMSRQELKIRAGRNPEVTAVAEPLPPERRDPISYMVHVVRSKGSLDGLVALDLNVDVVEILEAAKRSIASGSAVKLPLPR